MLEGNGYRSRGPGSPGTLTRNVSPDGLAIGATGVVLCQALRRHGNERY